MVAKFSKNASVASALALVWNKKQKKSIIMDIDIINVQIYTATKKDALTSFTNIRMGLTIALYILKLLKNQNEKIWCHHFLINKYSKLLNKMKPLKFVQPLQNQQNNSTHLMLWVLESRKNQFNLHLMN